MPSIKCKIKGLKKRRNDILLACLWALLIALIVIKCYWIAYNTSRRLAHEKPAYPSYDLLGVGPLDLFTLAIAGVIVTLFLSDFTWVIWAYFSSLILAFIISVTFIVAYMWYCLDLGSLFSITPFGLEWALYIAASIVFALMFPWIVCICTVSVAVGSLIRTIVD